MDRERIKQLEQFYKEDPNDPFNIYALALEYLKSNPSQTRRLFEILLEKHAHYLPTYYHAARFYQDLGEREKAMQVYDAGIALAREQNNEKTLRELRSAYDEMMFE